MRGRQHHLVVAILRRHVQDGAPIVVGLVDVSSLPHLHLHCLRVTVERRLHHLVEPVHSPHALPSLLPQLAPCPSFLCSRLLVQAFHRDSDSPQNTDTLPRTAL